MEILPKELEKFAFSIDLKRKILYNIECIIMHYSPAHGSLAFYNIPEVFV